MVTRASDRGRTALLVVALSASVWHGEDSVARRRPAGRCAPVRALRCRAPGHVSVMVARGVRGASTGRARRLRWAAAPHVATGSFMDAMLLP